MCLFVFVFNVERCMWTGRMGERGEGAVSGRGEGGGVREGPTEKSFEGISILDID